MKFLIIIGAILLLLSVSSCRKKFTCSCTDNTTGLKVKTTFGAVTKKSAKSNCEVTETGEGLERYEDCEVVLW